MEAIILNRNLKDCPFCGCRVTLEASLPKRDEYDEEYYIAYGEHKSHCPFNAKNYGCPTNADPMYLIKEWNTRV